MDRAPNLSLERLSDLLADGELARGWLARLGVRDASRGRGDLLDLAARVTDRSRLAILAGQFEIFLPLCSDPGMALTNFERFIASSRSPADTANVLASHPRTTEILLQIMSTSQTFSELLIKNPTLLEWLRGGATRRDGDLMLEELWEETSRCEREDDQKRVIREFHAREMLRIGYDDIVRDQPIELITHDLSLLAEACAGAALRAAIRSNEAKHGTPIGRGGEPARIVVVAFGKLGGGELNYSSDIDLMFIYDEEGRTSGTRSVTNAEFFARTAAQTIRLLSDHTPLGVAYRVDMRLRPEGSQGALARSLAATLGYYETMGRTWERQALIKCRPIAGSIELGEEFLDAIRPFVYRRYLSAAEINEIKAMKRRIEQRTLAEGVDALEVKTGRGGIRDVEFVVQFLQLLHGGGHAEVRHANTLRAIDRLEHVGCLTAEERNVMEETYRFLRRIEHRLQTMFDLQTHTMPDDSERMRALAIRMGYKPISIWEDRVGPAQRFISEYQNKTAQNRRILDHLLHDAFRDESGVLIEPAVDLVLDPAPSAEMITAALRPYPFRDHAKAYQNLMALAREEIPFLSSARSRHFLAAIAPRLLEALARTPDPDSALVNLEKVSASLGAKAILWELFSFNPPTLKLYVELCATSRLLSEILIGAPGMIDDLMDSLVIDRPQPARGIQSELAELCKGAEDPAPILLSFRNKEWLRIGARDLLGREPIREVLRELSDVAQAIVGRVARRQWERRVARYGKPMIPGRELPARWGIVALGKLGGRELTYQSDLDLVFIAETTGATRGGSHGSITNEQFFTELARGVLKQLGGQGGTALYAIDARLRPHGSSGALVVSLVSLRDYFHGPARAWERMALSRARVIHSTGGFHVEITNTIRELSAQPLDPAETARRILEMRGKLDQARAAGRSKRLEGIVDCEFLVQYLLLVHAKNDPELVRPNFWEALDRLRRAKVLSRREHTILSNAYTFFRTIESRLRIVHNRTPIDWIDRPEEIDRLMRGFHPEGTDRATVVEAFRSERREHVERVRELFFRELEAAAAGEFRRENAV